MVLDHSSLALGSYFICAAAATLSSNLDLRLPVKLRCGSPIQWFRCEENGNRAGLCGNPCCSGDTHVWTLAAGMFKTWMCFSESHTMCRLANGIELGAGTVGSFWSIIAD